MLRLEGVSKAFNGQPVVDNLSMRVPEGEVFGLLGPNGAGKTTTVRLITGMLQPDTGEIALKEIGRPGSAESRRALGVAPQELALYPELSGRENLRYFAQLYGLSGAKLRERVAWTLNFVDLTSRADDRAGNYSGGMKRRLNLALALLHEPQLLICDEPTVGVDPQSRNAILERLIDLKQNGQTIIYTTHYLEEAEQLCDRVAIVDHGRLLAEGEVAELIHRYAPQYVVVAENEHGQTRSVTDDPAQILSELQAAGPLGRIHIERPSLESVFLNLTGHQVRDA